LIPQLAGWTADFTVTALRATGIPVYREANHFVIPSGSWSVFEECSGIRYLIAFLMVGALYAYRRTGARYTGRHSLSWPLRFHWSRIGCGGNLTVMIGDVFGDEYSVGLAHILYGRGFFVWSSQFFSRLELSAERERVAYLSKASR
jgi:exosortase